MPDLDKSVSKMLVKDLRDELRARNLDTKGLKADLQARLEEAIANEGGGSVAKSSSSEQTVENPESASPRRSPRNTSPSGSPTRRSPRNSSRSSPVRSSPRGEKKKMDIKQVNEETEMEAEQETEQAMEVQKEEEKKRKVPEEKPLEHKKKESSPKRQKKEIPEVDSNTMKEILPTLGEKKQMSNAGKTVDKPNSVEPAKADIRKEVGTQVVAKNETQEEEKREVPPSDKTPTNTLFITHFVRPFTKPAVEQLLNKTGKTLKWDMDNIKSRCFVTYETIEEATATRESLHNLIWPPSNKTRLQVDYGTEEEAEQFLHQGKPTSDKPRPAAPKPQQHKVASEAKIKTLDDLFSKTQAQPPLYWKPLTEEEVEEKEKRAENDSRSNRR